MDWKTRIRELVARDVSIDEIASVMGVTPNAVRELREGRTKEPRWSAGARLVSLCQQHGIEPPTTDQAA